MDISSENERDRCTHYYMPLLEKHSYTHEAVGWGSSASQQCRFRVLTCVTENLQGVSILDVGCGLGHFARYLQENNVQCNYLGVDHLPEMVSRARKNHPNLLFQTGDIDSLPESKKFDYAFASGIFTFSTFELMQETIRKIFLQTRYAFAFNSLSGWAQEKEAGEFYADPLSTLHFCRSLTPWVVLRHDYMPHDFTIYMYHHQCQ